MRRNIVYSMVVLVLLFVLAGCGDKAQDNWPAASDPGTNKFDIIGRVTAIEGNRLLIVAKDANNPDNTIPMAIWVDFTQWNIKDVRIGYRVKAQSDGVMLDSYPMQTKGIKLEVVSSDMGSGDILGIVTGIHLDDADMSKNYIEVDGNKLGLLPSTVYWNHNNLVDAMAIQVGNKVEAWLPGYQVMDEKQATQIRIVG